MPKVKLSGMGGEREFPDKPLGDYEYEGDGKAQQEFFGQHSNIDELISRMSADDLDALDSWVIGHMMYGQQYRGWDKMNNYDKKLTEIYDDILDKSMMSQGVVVTRLSDDKLIFGKDMEGVSLSDMLSLTTEQILQKYEGRTIVSKGHMSSGVASQGLNINDRNKDFEYRIHIPTGAKGAGMWMGDSRVNRHWGARQREFLLNRDTAFRVGKSSYDRERGVYVVNLHYVGRMQHDYGTSGRLPKNSLDYYNLHS